MLCALFATAAPALADAPFMPNAKAPDYIVTMETKSFGRQTAGARIHAHHAGWTRIDTIENERPAIRFFGHVNSVLVRFTRDASGAFSYFDIQRGSDPSPLFIRDAFKTGEMQTVLGESCHVWNVMRARDPRLTLFSCVTDDGIELWRRYVGTRDVVSSAEATRIERRAVSPGDVRPPMEALDLKAWNESIDQSSPRMADSPADYEVVMEPELETTIPSARVTRIVRRHHPWTSIDERRADGQRTLGVRNELSHFSLRIEVHPQNGLRQLVVNKFPLRPPSETPVAGSPVDLDRSETVLGETCRWFDAMPGVMDAGLHECRTADGVVLKELRTGRGRYDTLVASRLTRRPVPLLRVLPPANMFAPRSWDLPE